MTTNLRDQVAEARHMAANAWCQDNTTMPEVEAFGAGWEAARDALLPLVEAERRRYAAEQLELVALVTVSGEDTPQDIREALFGRAASLRAGESA